MIRNSFLQAKPLTSITTGNSCKVFIEKVGWKRLQWFRFLWPCIMSKVWREKNQQYATIICLLLTYISTCFGHHCAHLQDNEGPVTAFGVKFWFCWMWLVAVVRRCLAGCEHYVLQWRRKNDWQIHQRRRTRPLQCSKFWPLTFRPLMSSIVDIPHR
jgi:hypothetical protein